MDAFCLKKVASRYPLSLLTCFAIWFLSLAPIGELKIVQDAGIGDKWAHFLMYAGFVAVMWAEWLRVQRASGSRLSSSDVVPLLVRMVLMPVAMSGVLELLQAYATTYRSGEWLDLAANAIGVGIGNVVGLAGACLMGRRTHTPGCD